MDQYAEMLVKNAYNILFRVFRHDFLFRIPVNNGHTNGWKVNTRSYSSWQHVCEPLCPIQSSTANQLLDVDNATATRFQYIWLSRKNVPVKTQVNWENELYSVVNRADYKEYANVYEYYLKGRSDIK